MEKRWIVTISFVTLFIFFIDPVFGLNDPAMAYCEELGYEFTIEETPEGEMGICNLPDGLSCMGWDFLKGKCGEEYSYCRKEGYELKTIADIEKCSSIFSEECAVCVLENGEEVEVTELMESSFEEGRCGDGACVLGESYENCPQDCSSGSFDLYCDKVSDGVCDPDCIDQGMSGEDPDCVTVTTVTETTTTTEMTVTTVTETTTTTEITTTTVKVEEKECGNGVCGYLGGENHLTCPDDCPSGGIDNYCDRVKDGICDPDCKGGDDPDCGPGYLLGYLPYIIILFVIIIIIYKKIRGE